MSRSTMFRGTTSTKLSSRSVIVMPTPPVRSALIAVLALGALAAAAPLRLLGVQAVGSTRYSTTEIAQSSGLKLGSEIDQDAVKAAARKLADSGVFAEVGYVF
ncbi:MAG: hypothetical protein LAO51_15875, partial [Acidobacteriia bacterium]|nr:hypothetical protein [Terriglobia bacterium]